MSLQSDAGRSSVFIRRVSTARGFIRGISAISFGFEDDELEKRNRSLRLRKRIEGIAAARQVSKDSKR